MFQDQLKLVSDLETKHKKTLSQIVAVDLRLQREKLSSLMRQEISIQTLRTRNAHYEQGNKSGKLLEHSLRENSRRNYVPHIDSDGGNRLFESSKIAEVFREYYQSLYNLQTNILSDQMVQKQQFIREYPASSGLPSISEDESKALNAPISIDEYMSAISTLRPHKALGPDGYTEVYYKAFAPTLGLRFIKAFNFLLEDRPPPINTLRAHIAVIP